MPDDVQPMTKQKPASTPQAVNVQILAALAKAMGQVQKLAKGDRNKHDGYNFASIDNFLELVNPICAEHGLIVHMQESVREDFERQSRNGTSAWMRQSFDITLWHVSGESLPPVTRTVEVLRNGAQAYGSAQSYALKQFWRCILLIPTGDKDDADFQPADAGTVRRDPLPDAPPAEAVERAIEVLTGAETIEQLRAIFTEMPRIIQAVPSVIKAKNERKADLEPAPAEPSGDRSLEEDGNFLEGTD